MATKAETVNRIVTFFKANEEIFTECIEDLDYYNGYLGDDRCYEMCFLDELYCNTEPTELLYRAFYGWDDDAYIIDNWGEKHHKPFNPNREYFYFNGYGNLVSTDKKDYSLYLDTYFVEDLSQNRNHIYLADDCEELEKLLDELESCEE